MNDRLIIDHAFGETRTVVIAPDGRLRDLFYDRDENPNPVGEIHLGRVRSAAPALGGAFVATGSGDVFLKAPARRLPPQGSPVALRVRAEPGGGKLPVAGLLTDEEAAHFLREQREAPALLWRDPHPWAHVIRQGEDRLSHVTTDAPDVLAALRGLAQDLPWLSGRLAFDRTAAPLMQRYGVEDQIPDLWSPLVALGRGASLSIEETRALTAIDVDAGGIATGRDETRTAETVHGRALAEIARQLRLRRIGGLVLVDVLRQRSRERRERLLHQLADQLEAAGVDAERPHFTALGLIEFKIRRSGRSLSSDIADPAHPGHPNAATAARMALRAAVAAAAGRPGQPVTIAAHPTVAARLRALRPEAEFLATAGAALTIEDDFSLDSGGFATYLRAGGSR